MLPLLVALPKPAEACLNSANHDVDLVTKLAARAERAINQFRIRKGCRMLTRRFTVESWDATSQIRIRSGNGFGSWPPGKFAAENSALAKRIENGLAYCAAVHKPTATKLSQAGSANAQVIKAWAEKVLSRDASESNLLAARHAEALLLMVGDADTSREILSELMKSKTMPTARSFAVLAKTNKLCHHRTVDAQKQCKKRAKGRSLRVCKVKIPKSVTAFCGALANCL